MKEEFKVKDKSPRKCCLQGSEANDKATKQFTSKTVACERNRWIAEAVSPDSQSRISAKQSTVCGTAQFNRCLCATKDTAEVSRVSNGK